MSIQIHGILYSYPHLCIIQQTACLHNSFFIHAADILMTTRIIYFIYSHPFLPFTPVFVLSSALTSWQKSKPLPRSKHGLLECRMKAFRYWPFRYFYPNRLKKCSKPPLLSPKTGQHAHSYIIIEIIYGCGPVVRLRQILHYDFRKTRRTLVYKTVSIALAPSAVRTFRFRSASGRHRNLSCCRNVSPLSIVSIARFC